MANEFETFEYTISLSVVPTATVTNKAELEQLENALKSISSDLGNFLIGKLGEMAGELPEGEGFDVSDPEFDKLHFALSTSVDHDVAATTPF